MDTPILRRSRISDAEALRDCVARVAREKRYLITVDGFSLEETLAFLRRIESEQLIQLVATVDERIVGWCDILPLEAPGFRHVGTLGLGVLAEWRGRGIGRQLIIQTIELARTTGLEKIELTVYSDNTRAMRLYESLGFEYEGRRRNARKLDGTYQDFLLMALPL